MSLEKGLIVNTVHLFDIVLTSINFTDFTLLIMCQYKLIPKSNLFTVFKLVKTPKCVF